MQVRIVQAIAGPANPPFLPAEYSYVPGQMVDLNDAQAAVWIAGAIAEEWIPDDQAGEPFIPAHEGPEGSAA
jgi:hypothetical protein